MKNTNLNIRCSESTKKHLEELVSHCQVSFNSQSDLVESLIRMAYTYMIRIPNERELTDHEKIYNEIFKIWLSE